MDGLPQIEETKEMPGRRRKVPKVHTDEDDDEDDDVTDDSFKNTNVSLMPEDTEPTKLAASLPEMEIKRRMQPPSTLKIVNRSPLAINKM